jgi:uncharacterized membrane protein YkvI
VSCSAISPEFDALLLITSVPLLVVTILLAYHRVSVYRRNGGRRALQGVVSGGAFIAIGALALGRPISDLFSVTIPLEQIVAPGGRIIVLIVAITLLWSEIFENDDNHPRGDDGPGSLGNDDMTTSCGKSGTLEAAV